MTTNDNNLHSGHRERLRQKFITGKDSFKEHELLELLLTYSIPRKNTNDIAHRLLKKFGSLKRILDNKVEILSSVEGVGENTACFLSLIGYLTKLNEDDKNLLDMSTIESAHKSILHLFKGLDHEIFYFIYLNNKNQVLGTTKLDSNKKSAVMVDFEKLTEGLIIYKPQSIIVAHNHFAKYPKPSAQDDVITEKIYTLLKLYKVNFYDHIIVSDKEIYSYFYDNRLQNIKQKIDDNFNWYKEILWEK